MSLSSLPGEQDIMTKLRTIPGIDVIEGEYTQDGYKPVKDADGMFKPYMLVKFNAGYPTYDNGIAGVQWDTLRATISIFVVSGTDANARSYRDDVRVAMLTNFQPTDSSALRPQGGYSFVDADLGYTRYCHVVQFAYITNITVP